MAHHFPQGWVDLEVTAEFCPEFEDSVSFFRRFGCIDCGGELQRIAEVSEEIQKATRVGERWAKFARAVIVVARS